MSKIPDIAYELAHRLNDLEHLVLYRQLAMKVRDSDLRAALAVVEGTAWPSRIPSPALFLLVLGARIGHPL